MGAKARIADAPFERQLLRHLDGEHNRSSLREAMRGLVTAGELTVEKDGLAISDDKQLLAVLSEAIDNQLAQFARSGLLMA